MEILNTYTEVSFDTWETTVFQQMREDARVISSFKTTCTISITPEDLKTILKDVDCAIVSGRVMRNTEYRKVNPQCIQDVLNEMNSVLEKTTTNRIKIIFN